MRNLILGNNWFLTFYHLTVNELERKCLLKPSALTWLLAFKSLEIRVQKANMFMWHLVDPLEQSTFWGSSHPLGLWKIWWHPNMPKITIWGTLSIKALIKRQIQLYIMWRHPWHLFTQPLFAASPWLGITALECQVWVDPIAAIINKNRIQNQQYE